MTVRTIDAQPQEIKKRRVAAYCRVSTDQDDQICFENLNLRGAAKGEILDYIAEKYPQHLDGYKAIYHNGDLSYWEQLEAEIETLSKEYAESRKKILEDRLDTYNSDLTNTELLKKSIEENKNLFKNNAEDSKFYYRYAIPYDEYGKLTGEILSISADSVASESSGTKFYIAQASLSEKSLMGKEGDVREVRTGMLLEAKSISGSKRVITWLLEKLNFID